MCAKICSRFDVESGICCICGMLYAPRTQIFQPLTRLWSGKTYFEFHSMSRMQQKFHCYKTHNIQLEFQLALSLFGEFILVHVIHSQPINYVTNNLTEQAWLNLSCRWAFTENLSNTNMTSSRFCPIQKKGWQGLASCYRHRFSFEFGKLCPVQETDLLIKCKNLGYW
jgi:hypothetical protein